MNQCVMDVRVFSGSKACNDRTMRSWSSGMIRFSLPERRERKARKAIMCWRMVQ